ncbi:MAG: NAD(P)-binding domain-containing protein [Chitinophagales bacterium]
MKIGVLGTGVVGSTIGTKLIELGHEVKMGSRDAENAKGLAWVAQHPERASLGTFNEAASFAELLFNCTHGQAALDILQSIEAQHLDGKVLLDLTNPLDFSKGMPPTLTVCNTDSLGEQIQRSFPKLNVVKTLNTMWCGLMVEPGMINNGNHNAFICGNDAGAKQVAREMLLSFGWKVETILDLGDITNARGTEMWLALWVRLYGSAGNGAFNMHIVQ